MADIIKNDEKEIFIYPIKYSKEWEDYVNKHNFTIATDRINNNKHYIVYSLFK